MARVRRNSAVHTPPTNHVPYRAGITKRLARGRPSERGSSPGTQLTKGHALSGGQDAPSASVGFARWESVLSLCGRKGCVHQALRPIFALLAIFVCAFPPSRPFLYARRSWHECSQLVADRIMRQAIFPPSTNKRHVRGPTMWCAREALASSMRRAQRPYRIAFCPVYRRALVCLKCVQCCVVTCWRKQSMLLWHRLVVRSLILPR